MSDLNEKLYSSSHYVEEEKDVDNEPDDSIDPNEVSLDTEDNDTTCSKVRKSILSML
jgi:hypothetical protein